ncbi:MAG TPA: nuclear transport factor 2 family protein [Terriglobales bacterium]|nr:nuclear transport factor 2 family protein [Terriglobales bacterium]
MMRIAAMVLLLSSVPILGHAACAVHDSKTKEGLLRAENRWVAALDKTDANSLACILAPEFKDSGVYGELRDRQKVMSDLPHRRPAKQELRNVEAVLLGGTGVVRGVNHLTTSEGKPLADVRFTDVFVYRDHRWQAVSAQETLVKEENRR